MLTSSVISWRHSKFQKLKKNRWKLMKKANIDREGLHIFWTNWEISLKFSGKMWLMIILEVTKTQGFTLSLEDTSVFFSVSQKCSWKKSKIYIFCHKRRIIFLIHVTFPRTLVSLCEIASINFQEHFRNRNSIISVFLVLSIERAH